MGHDFVLTVYVYNFINNIVDIYKFHNSSPYFIQVEPGKILYNIKLLVV